MISLPITESAKLCPIHGVSMLEITKSPIPFCLECQKVDRQQPHFENDGRLLNMRRNCRIKTMNIPEEFSSINFENLDLSNIDLVKQIEIMKIYQKCILKSNPTNLYLAGTTGAGKTCLAICLLKSLNHKLPLSQKMHFETSSNICDEIITAKQDFTINENEIYNKYSEIDVLVLDDFGFDDDSEARKRIIQKLLTLRYNRRKSTIITSNLPLNLCQERMGDRCWSRFQSRLFDFPSMLHSDYRNNRNLSFLP